MPPEPSDISSIGEFGLIQRIRRIVGDPPAGVLAGISDDAAAWRPAPGKVLLLSTDSFAEGIHFDLTFTSMKHLGWKVMAAALSDIAAMGGVPRLATVALSLPPKITVPMIEEFYAGVAASMKAFDCAVVGGDTTASAGNLTVTVSVTGEADEAYLRFRRGAKPGDYLCVTGHLGASLAGLRVLQREKERYLTSLASGASGSPGESGSSGQSGGPNSFQPNLEPYAAALEKHFMPRPRTDFVALTAGRIGIRAMIDVSDGLASEVRHLCEAGGVGAVVHEHNLPLEGVTRQVAEEFGESPTDYALLGGEEYELLFTLGDEEYANLEPLTADVTIVGRIVEREKGITYVREDGTTVPLPAGGWDHFTKRDGTR